MRVVVLDMESEVQNAGAKDVGWLKYLVSIINALDSRVLAKTVHLRREEVNTVRVRNCSRRGWGWGGEKNHMPNVV